MKAIPEIWYEVDPDDGKLAGFSIQRHSFCILPSITTSDHQPTEDQPSIQAQLNATLNAHAKTSREANIIRREVINRLKEKDEIEKDKSSTLIHKSVLRMIMMSASQDGERPACEIPGGCKTFMNCTGAGMTES